MAEVKITYETLFDLLRREKGRNELQSLDETFYSDVIEYLKEKNKIIEKTEAQSALFSRSEFEKNKIQIRNIHKILKELYELREKKIINLATNKIKTGSDLIDTSSLLPEEVKLFEEACELLSKHKKIILHNVVHLDIPKVETSVKKDSVKEDAKEEKKEKISENVEVKILSDLPKFVGLDKKIYGPFSRDEIVELPGNIAELLTKKGRALII